MKGEVTCGYAVAVHIQVEKVLSFRSHPAEADGNRPWFRWRFPRRVAPERMLRRDARSNNSLPCRFLMSDPAYPRLV